MARLARSLSRQWLVSVGAVLLGCLLVPAAAQSAPAAGPHSKAGFLGVVPKGGHSPSLRTFSQPPLIYHGGPVLRSNTSHTFYWDPASSLSPSYRTTIDTFFTDVAANSGLRTNVYSTDIEYSDSTGRIAYDSTFGGAVLDSTAYPASGCPVVAPYTTCLTDQQLIDELGSYIDAHSLPQGVDQVYMVFLPENVDTCFDDTGIECASNLFCAYHSAFDNGGPTDSYAVMPFPVTECDPGMRPNGNIADAVLDGASHEHNEAITDPLGDAWYDDNGLENGDKCNNTYGPTVGGAGTGQYNQVINSHHYWIQEEWSNVAGGCLQSLPPQPPTASFVSTPTSPTTGQAISFDGSPSSDPDGSIVSYAWDFGDGTTATGVGPSHAFAVSGSHTVRLTVTDNDGSTNAVSRAILVSNRPPIAAFQAPGAVVSGTSVKFDSSASNDPDGRILAYSWDFGDETTASGPSPTHRFTGLGAYTVSLGVVDDSGNPAFAQKTIQVVPRALTSLSVPKSQRGGRVHGVATIGQDHTRLQLKVLALSSQLGGARRTVVGKLVRKSVHAGKVKFSIALNRAARQALAAGRGLKLIVRASATGPVGSTVSAGKRATLLR